MALYTDQFTGADGSAWSGSWIFPGTGTPDIFGNQGRATATSSAANALGPRAYLSAMTAAASYDMVIDVLVDQAGAQHWVTVGMGGSSGVVSNNFPPNGYSIQLAPLAGTFAVSRSDGSARTQLASVAHTYVPGVMVRCRLRKLGAVISATVWNVGDPEPSSPDWTVTDSAPNHTAGRPWVMHVNGTTAGTRVVFYDNLLVTDLSPTLVGTGAIVASGTGVTLPYPAGILAGDLVLMAVTAKADTAAMPDIAGWTKVIDRVVGTGTAGAGTGPQRMALYRRYGRPDGTADGSETGNVIVQTSPLSNAIAGDIQAWRSSTGLWDLAYATGSDDVSHTAMTATGDTVLGEQPGDVMLYYLVGSGSGSYASTGSSAAGATYGALTERNDGGTASGNRIRLVLNDRQVTTGPATGVPTVTSTISQAATGGAMFIRLREVQPIAAVMTNGSSLSPASMVTRPAAAAMTTGSTLTVAGRADKPATATMTSGSALAAGPVVERQSPAATMATGTTLAVAGRSTTTGAATMTVGATLDAGPAVAHPATASMSGGSTLVVGPAVHHPSGAAMSSGSVLEVGSAGSQQAAAAMVSTTTLTVGPSAAHPDAATMASGSTLSLQAVVSREAAAAMAVGLVLDVGPAADRVAGVVMVTATELVVAARQDELVVLVMVCGSELVAGAEDVPPVVSGPSVHFVGGPYVHRLHLAGPLVARRDLAGPHVARLHLIGPEVR